jgi:hypothetical protein
VLVLAGVLVRQLGGGPVARLIAEARVDGD